MDSLRLSQCKHAFRGCYNGSISTFERQLQRRAGVSRQYLCSKYIPHGPCKVDTKVYSGNVDLSATGARRSEKVQDFDRSVTDSGT